MLVELRYMSGNKETFETTALSHAEDQTGILVDNNFIDFLYPDDKGLLLDRRYFSEEEDDITRIKDRIVLRTAEEMENVAVVSVDREVVMVRSVDADGTIGEWVNVAEAAVRKMMESVLQDPFGGDEEVDVYDGEDGDIDADGVVDGYETV